MAVSTVSKDSEGIYTGLVFPDQDVYSTLDHTSPNSPREQHQERSVGSSHPCRRAAVCLGLLCALLLTATLVLCVLYTSQYQKYSLLERELEVLQRDNSISQRTVSKKLLFMEQYCPISSQKRECKPCPQGWKRFDSKCYYFSTEFKIWTESRNDCIKWGADLVIIESKEEQDFISRSNYHDDYWIGLSDSVTEGIWLWVDGSALQGGFWGRGEPDDYYDQEGHREADCVATVKSDKLWIDTHCWMVIPFICETDALLP